MANERGPRSSAWTALFTEHRDQIGAVVCFGFAALLTAFALSALL